MARFTASSSERLGRVGAGVTRVYLDYASFSPVDPRVVALMRPFLEGGVGNPGAPHSLGLDSIDFQVPVLRLFVHQCIAHASAHEQGATARLTHCFGQTNYLVGNLGHQNHLRSLNLE